jgi:hypothetical protein
MRSNAGMAKREGDVGGGVGPSDAPPDTKGFFMGWGGGQ